MLTHIQCANVCTYNVYVYISVALFVYVFIGSILNVYMQMFYHMLHT